MEVEEKKEMKFQIRKYGAIRKETYRDDDHHPQSCAQCQLLIGQSGALFMK